MPPLPPDPQINTNTPSETPATRLLVMNISFTSLTEEQNEMYSTAQKLPVSSRFARYAIGVARRCEKLLHLAKR